jgi:hypothetical protein
MALTKRRGELSVRPSSLVAVLDGTRLHLPGKQLLQRPFKKSLRLQ